MLRCETHLSDLCWGRLGGIPHQNSLPLSLNFLKSTLNNEAKPPKDSPRLNPKNASNSLRLQSSLTHPEQDLQGFLTVRASVLAKGTSTLRLDRDEGPTYQHAWVSWGADIQWKLPAGLPQTQILNDGILSSGRSRSLYSDTHVSAYLGSSQETY